MVSFSAALATFSSVSALSPVAAVSGVTAGASSVPYTTGRLTPPTIEIVGFPGGSGKAYHHAAYKAASYAVSHQQLRV